MFCACYPLNDMLWFQFLGNDDNVILLDKVLKQRSAVQRWKNCQVLVIDEVSMLHPERFELLDQIARNVKRNNYPFGGMQLILSGDFMQLSPITVRDLSDLESKGNKYCFQTNIWRDAGLLKIHGGTIQLEEVLRQKGDSEFVDLLNEVRKGHVSSKSLELLNSCVVGKKERPTDGIIPTKLYCYNRGADEENLRKLAELPGEVVSVSCVDTWKIMPQTAYAQKVIVEAISKEAPQTIELKMGAQVMLLRNQNTGENTSSKLALVNGSRGVIVGLKKSVPTVKFDNGEIVQVKPAEYEYVDPKGNGHFIRRQIPLKLAW